MLKGNDEAKVNAYKSSLRLIKEVFVCNGDLICGKIKDKNVGFNSEKHATSVGILLIIKGNFCRVYART